MIRGIKTSDKKQHIDVSIHNRFDIEVIDSVTGKKKQSARAYNTICDGLWEILAAKSYSDSGGYFHYIGYGSGTGTPSPSDLQLFNLINTKRATDMKRTQDPLSGIISVQKRIVIQETESVGSTLTEVGIFSYNPVKLSTHAVIVDMNNNPISIVKTDTDIINIYATVFLHYSPFGYDNGTIKINPEAGLSSVQSRYSNLFNTLLGIETGYYSQAIVYSLSNTNNIDNGYQEKHGYIYSVSSSIKFDLDTHSVTIKSNRLPANTCDAPGFCTAMIAHTNQNNASSYSIPDITCFVGGEWYKKSHIQDESVGTGDGSLQDFDLKFPYASNLRLYLDGKETTDFTYNYMIPEVNTVASHNKGLCIWLDKRSREDLLIPASLGFDTYVDMLFNPMYIVGLKSVRLSGTGIVEASNDLQSWHEAGSSTGSSWVPISDEYKHYKYFRTNSNFDVDTTSRTKFVVQFPDNFTNKAIHFNTPPADGVTITADYDSKSISKDVNHVFDFSLTINLGEYTEAQ